VKTLDELINSRRSIRKYTATPPPEEYLHEMVCAAVKAPSPSNRQPVRFVRIRSKAARESLQEAMRLGKEKLLDYTADSAAPKRLRNWINVYYRFSEFMADAPVLFAVGTSTSSLSLEERLPEAEACGKGDGRRRDLDISVGLSLMGYLLKGEELGLGSCILTAPLFFIDEPEKILSLDRIDIRCFVTTGYVDKEPAPIRRESFAEMYGEI
jgi:nitroreductase